MYVCMYVCMYVWVVPYLHARCRRLELTVGLRDRLAHRPCKTRRARHTAYYGQTHSQENRTRKSRLSHSTSVHPGTTAPCRGCVKPSTKAIMYMDVYVFAFAPRICLRAWEARRIPSQSVSNATPPCQHLTQKSVRPSQELDEENCTI
jgi:hypothetical protein